MLDGTPVRNLDGIPENTQVLIVSELPYPKDAAYLMKLMEDKIREDIFRRALLGENNLDDSNSK